MYVYRVYSLIYRYVKLKLKLIMCVVKMIIFSVAKNITINVVCIHTNAYVCEHVSNIVSLHDTYIILTLMIMVDKVYEKIGTVFDVIYVRIT